MPGDRKDIILNPFDHDDLWYGTDLLYELATRIQEDVDPEFAEDLLNAAKALKMLYIKYWIVSDDWEENEVEV